MSIEEQFPPSLLQSSLADGFKQLDDIYARIEREQDAWIAATPYRCPSGCGSCCERFEPDVLEIEALYLAAWMLRHSPEALDSCERHGDRKGCVLALPEGEYHCGVYGGRPLICRLFAYSGDRAKDGSARFAPCAHMPVAGKRPLGEAELLERFGQIPPLMGDLASMALSIRPDLADVRLPIREAVPLALAKLRLITELSSANSFALLRALDPDNNGGDNDNPGGNTPPVPRAS